MNHGVAQGTLLNPVWWPKWKGKSKREGIYVYVLHWWLSSKKSACNAWGKQTQVWSMGQEDPLEEAMETHSSIFAWRIPWTEEPG